ncbi:hypothetical protein ASG38_00180 [Flavobacterium sp. Leaf359]|nr:hypothetical protein ASG38_00180 [Flavobacterium sp. Leaf359]
MKNIIICFFFIGCAKYNRSEIRSDIDMKLTNTSIKDSTDLKITITNNSLKNYYLLYSSKSVNDIMKEFNNSGALYTISAVIVDDENSSIDLKLYEGSCPYDSPVHTTKDILKLKPKQKIKLSIPFRMKTNVSEDCYYGYMTDTMLPDKQYYVYAYYYIGNEYFKNALPKTIKDSLEQMGYELYEKEIVSNRVPLILKK